jgi:hypothetical protein
MFPVVTGGISDEGSLWNRLARDVVKKSVQEKKSNTKQDNSPNNIRFIYLQSNHINQFQKHRLKGSQDYFPHGVKKA